MKKNSYLSPWIWLVYLLLFAGAIPWYWSTETIVLWFGFPRWVVVSVAGSAVISCFTAWLLLTRWPVEGEEE